MPRLFGPRTAVEAAFIVAVPISVGFGFGASRWTIVAAAGVAYLLIVLVEAFIWYEAKRVPAGRQRMFAWRAKRKEAPVPAEAPEESVVVRPRAEPEAEAVPEPVLEPEPKPEPESAPHAPTDHVRVLRREPEPEPEPVVVVVVPEPERAPLAAVPSPEPEPVSIAAPAHPAPASTVVSIGVSSSPRQWNLWDLERLTRES
jgi:hypothetical protein